GGTGPVPGRPATASAVGPCKRPPIERRGRPSTSPFVQPRASSCLLAGRTTFPVAALQPTNGVADSGQVVHPLSFESFRQALSGPAQSHVNGSRVDVQEFGNLAGIILQSVTQCQDLPVRLWHLLEDTTQLSECFFTLQVFQRRHVPGLYPIHRLWRVGAITPESALGMVLRQVASHPQHPGSRVDDVFS